MPSIDEKLELFKKIIIDDATKSRDAVLDQLKAEADKKLAESTAEIDREAAELFARERAKAAQQKEARISMAIINAKKMLIATRNDIFADVLGGLSDKLGEFAKSDAYGGYLAGSVRDMVQYVGEAHADIYLTPQDYDRHRAAINGEFAQLNVLRGDVAMIGGCRVINDDLGIYIDNSFEKKVEMCVDELFKKSELKVSV
jgi:V/A-type H+-transporting ATPase subunit E